MWLSKRSSWASRLPARPRGQDSGSIPFLISTHFYSVSCSVLQTRRGQDSGAHTHMHTHIQTRTHKRTHAQTRMRARTHTHTQTHAVSVKDGGLRDEKREQIVAAHCEPLVTDRHLQRLVIIDLRAGPPLPGQGPGRAEDGRLGQVAPPKPAPRRHPRVRLGRQKVSPRLRRRPPPRRRRAAALPASLLPVRVRLLPLPPPSLSSRAGRPAGRPAGTKALVPVRRARSAAWSHISESRNRSRPACAAHAGAPGRPPLPVSIRDRPGATGTTRMMPLRGRSG